jgi:hypothetical protein
MVLEELKYPNSFRNRVPTDFCFVLQMNLYYPKHQILQCCRHTCRFYNIIRPSIGHRIYALHLHKQIQQKEEKDAQSEMFIVLNDTTKHGCTLWGKHVCIKLKQEAYLHRWSTISPCPICLCSSTGTSSGAT